MEIPSYFIPTIIVLVLACLIILGFALWYRHRYERIPNSPAHMARELEATDSSAGDQVWFSRQIHRGKWRKWSLVVRNRRYEVRAGDVARGEPGCVFQTSACELAYERQQALRDGQIMPGYKGSYVCLIGWTRKSDEEIEVAGEKVLAQGLGWGKGDADGFEGRVQDFLKGLGERILEQKKATDYGWFRDNVTSHWKDVEAKLMAGPEVGSAGGRSRSMQQLASVDAGVRAWAYA